MAKSCLYFLIQSPLAPLPLCTGFTCNGRSRHEPCYNTPSWLLPVSLYALVTCKRHLKNEAPHTDLHLASKFVQRSRTSISLGHIHPAPLPAADPYRRHAHDSHQRQHKQTQAVTRSWSVSRTGNKYRKPHITHTLNCFQAANRVISWLKRGPALQPAG